MSIDRQLYIGPYLCITPHTIDVGAVTKERLFSLIGDRSLSDGNCYGDADYIGANISFGITRQMIWSSKNNSADVLVVNESLRRREMQCFHEYFIQDIVILRQLCNSIVLQWGAVPGWF